MQGDGSKMLSVGKMLALGALSRLRSSAWLYLAPVAAAAFTPIGDLRAYLCRRLQLHRRARRLLPFLDPFVTVDIAARRDDYAYSSSAGRIKSSDAYTEVLAYLSSVSSRDARQLRAEGAAEGDGFVFSLREGQEVADVFNGVTMWWSSATAVPGLHFHGPHGPPCCRLTFHERHRSLAVDEYLPHVRRRGQEVLFGNRRRRLYTNRNGLNYGSRTNEVWSYIDFDHPTTFDTLAMDPAKKRAIMDDLDDFRNNGDYYHRIGKAWKRGYLLHGPPGTGKTTMIAAMANHLGYDIYDIELTTMHSNNDLRKLFVETTGRSIIVIEDIDCSLDLTGSRARAAALQYGDGVPPQYGHGPVDAYGRNATTHDDRGGNIMTLSGLLNFIDGLWSAHSGERIIVFTTNHLDKLDPALIRRGRMDMHIEMSYCGFEAFRKLAENYLGVDAHPLFDAVRELLRAVEITPADVAECLITSKRSARDADACLGRLLDELKKKAGEKEEQSKAEVDVAESWTREQMPVMTGGSFCSADEML